MKIAVITAVFGGMDTEKPFCKQSVDCDRIFINEQNSPFPLPNLPPRLQAKYFKLQAHRAFPGYDCYVWIDGNIEVTSPMFVEEITDRLRGEICIQRHHERKTIKEEIDFILNSDNPYLTTRYGAQPLKEEYEYYLREGMEEDAALYSCNIFAWHSTEKTNGFFDKWWRLTLEWSWFDQSQFSFLAWNCPLIRIVNFGPMFDNPFFKLHGHDRWNQ
jgi:hypothetical protein